LWVWGSGFGVQGLGFRVHRVEKGPGNVGAALQRCEMQCRTPGVDSGLRVWGLGLWSTFKLLSSGFRVFRLGVWENPEASRVDVRIQQRLPSEEGTT